MIESLLQKNFFYVEKNLRLALIDYSRKVEKPF